jgi:hypothetical protein
MSPGSPAWPATIIEVAAREKLRWVEASDAARSGAMELVSRHISAAYRSGARIAETRLKKSSGLPQIAAQAQNPTQWQHIRQLTPRLA